MSPGCSFGRAISVGVSLGRAGPVEPATGVKLEAPLEEECRAQPSLFSSKVMDREASEHGRERKRGSVASSSAFFSSFSVGPSRFESLFLVLERM